MKNELLTKKFWVELGIKTMKTAFQASYGVMVAAQSGLLKDVDFGTMLQVAGYTALACVLMNVGAAKDVVEEPPAPPADIVLPPLDANGSVAE